MGYAVQQHAALITESGRGVGGRDPAMLDLGTVRIEIRILAGALEDNKLAAFLMYIEATFYSEREGYQTLPTWGNYGTYPRTESPACQSPWNHVQQQCKKSNNTCQVTAR